MEYTQEFKDFVNACMRYDGQNLHVGTGNPNAKTLFVGKEAAMHEADNGYKNNAKHREQHIYEGTCEILTYPVGKDCFLRKDGGETHEANIRN